MSLSWLSFFPQWLIWVDIFKLYFQSFEKLLIYLLDTAMLASHKFLRLSPLPWTTTGTVFNRYWSGADLNLATKSWFGFMFINFLLQIYRDTFCCFVWSSRASVPGAHLCPARRWQCAVVRIWYPPQSPCSNICSSTSTWLVDLNLLSGTNHRCSIGYWRWVQQVGSLRQWWLGLLFIGTVSTA
jgi:hypothetical protein